MFLCLSHRNIDYHNMQECTSESCSEFVKDLLPMPLTPQEIPQRASEFRKPANFSGIWIGSIPLKLAVAFC
jgi:hypothetical protein